ncbi:unnamed protein product [Prunus armeniaca]
MSIQIDLVSSFGPPTRRLLIQVANQPLSVEGADEESGLADGETHNFKRLLEKTNSQKDTAMHVAFRCGHRKVVLLLMKAGPEFC